MVNEYGTQQTDYSGIQGTDPLHKPPKKVLCDVQLSRRPCPTAQGRDLPLGVSFRDIWKHDLHTHANLLRDSVSKFEGAIEGTSVFTYALCNLRAERHEHPNSVVPILLYGATAIISQE